MTLTNPYDKPPKKEKQEKTEEKRSTHHAVIHRKKALELCKYSTEAYKPEEEQEVASRFIEHSVFGVNDIQCLVYTRDNMKIVSFRGTQEGTDWLTDFNVNSVKLSTIFDFITDEEDLIAHRGFTTSLKPIYQQIKDEILDSFFELTGHSYGGALATIFAYVYAIDTGNQPEHFYTFGTPRAFINSKQYPVSRYNDLLEMVRIQNNNDVISYYPQKGGYEAVAKHAGAGAVVGSALGSIGGGLLGGAIMGAVSGAGLGVASGGYTHVGTGMILFEDVDSVVYTGTGAERLLKGKNYYLMPEGVDMLRDPLDINSTLTQKLFATASIEEAFGMVRRLYANYEGFSSFMSEGMKDGVIARAKNIFNVAFREQLSGDIIARVARSRQEGDVIQRSNIIYHSQRLSRNAGLVWANPARYLSGELLERLDLMDEDMRRATDSWFGRISYQDAGFSSPVSAEDLNYFQQIFNENVLGLMNEQLFQDMNVAKKFYSMLGLSMLVEGALVGYAGYDVYTKTVGHKLIHYQRRLMDLPETIYEGFAKQDTLYSPDATFKQINDNVYFSNGQYYYLTHHQDKTTLRPMIQKIYGYILYSPEEEAEHVNKLICF